MAKKKIVALISGGPSAEYEVSLNTGKNIASALKNNARFKVRSVIINKKGEWQIGNKKILPFDCLKNVDVVFNAMHGEFGEDGTIQGFLDTLGIPYTGSGLSASVIGLDKLLTRLLLIEQGIKTPRYKIIMHEHHIGKLPFGLPVVIKPNARGSSVGVNIVKNKTEFDNALRTAFRFDSSVIVEEFINGTEITVGILENFRGQRYFPLPVTEIVPDKRFLFFDYEAKYTTGATDEINPARISAKLTKKAQDLGIKVFQATRARHYARIDMIIGKNNDIYVLETNTLPGMTANSLLPKQVATIGLPFVKLIEHLLNLALKNKS